jgi:alpha-tubulin suppressor-like RCC1 family protein
LNIQGQLGDGSTSQRNSPVAVNLPGGVTGFKSVTPGSQTACGVANTGVFYCWGNGNNCRRPGTCSGSVSTPTATTGYPSGAVEWKQIGLGSVGCAIGQNDRAYCWGWNSNGQVGNNSTSDTSAFNLLSLPSGRTKFIFIPNPLFGGLNSYSTCALLQ